MALNRAVIVVLDSLGIGSLPDAHRYGDEKSNTLTNVSLAVGGLELPNLKNMGIANITDIEGVTPVDRPEAAYGKMKEKSPGKDTTTGHWEIAGTILKDVFPTYPNGFPKEIISEFEARIDAQILGNEAASGTEIIKRLGEEHLKTGKPIVYTSADSVFQIAAHEEVIPLKQLYEMCETARSILTGKHAVARVIARPFIGRPGSFKRTPNRKDYSLKPPDKNLLTNVKDAGLEVCSIGKIDDIFAGQGITESVKTTDNMDGVDKTLKALKRIDGGLIFVNLIDFDMLYGHRNDPKGYAGALEEFDKRIPELLTSVTDKDVLILTADHGCDPTLPSTDHSREYVPFFFYGKKIKPVYMGIRDTFADLGATVADMLGVSLPPAGKSFAGELVS